MTGHRYHCGILVSPQLVHSFQNAITGSVLGSHFNLIPNDWETRTRETPDSICGIGTRRRSVYPYSTNDGHLTNLWRFRLAEKLANTSWLSAPFI
jgi:hypothetical protein